LLVLVGLSLNLLGAVFLVLGGWVAEDFESSLNDYPGEWFLVTGAVGIASGLLALQGTKAGLRLRVLVGAGVQAIAAAALLFASLSDRLGTNDSLFKAVVLCTIGVDVAVIVFALAADEMRGNLHVRTEA
jgi:hypothetical protein